MRTRLVRRLAIAGTTLVAAALLAGCGNDDHPGTDHDSGSPTAGAPAGNATFNDTDTLFATDMIAHHRQAIEMARLAETRASDPQVKELAARIKTAQGPEIVTMSSWLNRWGQPVPSEPAGMSGMDHGSTSGTNHAGMPGMMTDQEMHDLMAASGASFDKMFLQMMIRHHQGAIEMAATEQRQGRDARAKQLAAKIAADQSAEVTQLRDLLGRLS